MKSFFGFFSMLGNWGTLGWALLISVALHAVLLSIRFVDPERFNRMFKDTPLEIILVNSHSQEKPEKAKAIAQTSLAGGGEDNAGRVSTPLPKSEQTQAGDAHEDASKVIENLLEQQRLLLEERKSELAASQSSASTAPSDLTQPSREQSKKMTQDKIAEIERRINEENSRPKKRFVSPSTMEAVYATYYDGVRSRIEDKGTSNFPEMAGRRLYGDLVMSITVDHRGQTTEVKIEQSSGNRELDRRALAIAQGAGPFKPFGDKLRQQAELLVFVLLFNFSKNNTLEAQITQSKAASAKP